MCLRIKEENEVIIARIDDNSPFSEAIKNMKFIYRNNLDIIGLNLIINNNNNNLNNSL